MISRTSWFGTPGLVELDDREANALLEDVARLRMERTATDIGKMRDRAGIGHNLAVLEDRRDHRHVGQMPGADLRIVGGENVALFERVSRKLRQEVLLRGDRKRA